MFMYISLYYVYYFTKYEHCKFLKKHKRKKISKLSMKVVCKNVFHNFAF